MASAEKEYFPPETSVSCVDPHRIPLALTTTFVSAVHRFAIRDILSVCGVTHFVCSGCCCHVTLGEQHLSPCISTAGGAVCVVFCLVVVVFFLYWCHKLWSRAIEQTLSALMLARSHTKWTGFYLSCLSRKSKHFVIQRIIKDYTGIRVSLFTFMK